MDFKIKDENYYNAILHLLVQNNIQIQALGTTLIEILSKSNEDADENIKILNEQIVQTQEKALQNLYVLFGDLDINKLL